jgi:hypothetical protein
MLYEYYFQGRKPSIKQVLKQVEEGIKQNSRVIEISWGENMLTIERVGANTQWYGYGWIKGIGGDDIAHDLNAKQTRNTLNLWNS